MTESSKAAYVTPGDRDATPPLRAFLDAYREDDNEWWRLSSGHHRNLFDEAVDRGNVLALALNDVLARLDRKGHPGEPCLRADWVGVETVERWRRVLRDYR